MILEPFVRLFFSFFFTPVHIRAHCQFQILHKTSLAHHISLRQRRGYSILAKVQIIHLSAFYLRHEIYETVQAFNRYFTLRHVWGTKNYLRLEKASLEEASSQDFSFGANFHPSVSDTITLMNGMKETYLWVDSLCIVQDSDSNMRAQID